MAIIEVAFSQKAKELKYLADNYILGSNGNVRVVIGISIEYEGYEKGTRPKKEKQSRKAAFSIWRPQLVKDGDGGEVLEAVQNIEEQVSSASCLATTFRLLTCAGISRRAR